MGERLEDTARLDCLSDDEVFDYLERALPPEAEARVVAHVDRCPRCRRLLGFSAQDRPPLPSPAPATRIGPFQLIRRIGGGGMGEVHLAQDTELLRPVALKLISPELLDSKVALERFLVEARATARLAHPNVVAIHSVGTHAGQPYIALEYVTGKTLKAWLDERRATEAEVVSIGRQIAEALAAAHAAGVLHRDLKPANVMVEPDGRVRVLDFGLAQLEPRRLLAELGTLSGTPLLGGLQGTPGYMAPEQWKGQPASPRTDVWALGVVLYELLAGDRPFRAPSAVELALEISSETRAPALPAGLAVSAPLAALVAACLEKAAADRPTAAEVALRLERMFGDERRRIAADLERAASAWATGEGPLWGGSALARAEVLLEAGGVALAPEAARFLGASLGEEKRREARGRRRLFASTLAAVGFAALSTGLLLAAYRAERAAAHGRRLAELARAEALVEGAARTYELGDRLSAESKLRTSLELGDGARARLLAEALEGSDRPRARSLGTGLYAVAFVDRGARLAVAGQDRAVHLVDTDTLATRSFAGHRDQVLLFAATPEGELVSAGWGGELRVLDLASGGARALPGARRRPRALAVAPGGGEVLVLDADGLLREDLRGVAARGSVATARRPEAAAFAGERLVVLEEDGALRSYAWPSLRRIGELKTGLLGATLLAVSPSGEVAIAGEAAWAVVDPARGAVVRRGAEAGPISALALFPSGALAIGRRDGGVVVVDDARHVHPGHRASVWGIAVHPDGQRFATVGTDTELHLYLQPRPPARPPLPHQDAIASLELAPRAGVALSGGYDQVVVEWSLATGLPTRRYEGFGGTVYGLALGADGTHFAAASKDGAVRAIDRASGRTIFERRPHEADALAVAGLPDGRWVSGGGDGRVVLLDPRAASEVELTRHAGPVYELAADPRGRWVLSGSTDGSVRRTALAPPRRVDTYPGAGGPVFALAIDRGGEVAVAGSHDGRVRALFTGEVLAEGLGRVYGLRFGADGGLLAATADGRVVELGGRGRALAAHHGEVNALAIGGGLLASAGDDGTVRFFAEATWSARFRSLWLDDEGRLVTSSDVRTAAGPRPPSRAVERRALEAGRAGSARGGWVCLLTGEGVEIWPAEAEVPAARAVIDEVAAVFAAPGGCLVVARDRLIALSPSGSTRDLGERPGALAASAGEVWLVGPRGLGRLRGERVELVGAGHPDASALAIDPAGEWAAIGDPSGEVELRPLAGGTSTRVGATAGRRVTALAFGPMSTLAVGYASGRLALFDRASRAALSSVSLHGAVVEVRFVERRLLAASELGQLHASDAFVPGTCELVSRVARRIPTVWIDGAPAARAEGGERCREGGPR